MTSFSARAREFRDRGFVTVKGLLPKSEAETYVRHLERLSGRTRESFEKYRVGRGVLKRGVYRGWTLPDGVSKTPEFWDLLVHPELLGVVREVLGPEACFLQHTDLHVGFSSAGGTATKLFAPPDSWFCRAWRARYSFSSVEPQSKALRS